MALIIVIDREKKTARSVIVRILKADGHQVLPCAVLGDALPTFGTMKPALVLADPSPFANAERIIADIRALAPAVPLLIVPALLQPAAMDSLTEVLPKPFTSNALREKVNIITASHRGSKRRDKKRVDCAGNGHRFWHESPLITSAECVDALALTFTASAFGARLSSAQAAKGVCTAISPLATGWLDDGRLTRADMIESWRRWHVPVEERFRACGSPVRTPVHISS